jgi:diguanylate cyclase (GGDEF)-like protein
MKSQFTGDSIIRWLLRIWEGLVPPTTTNKMGERRPVQALSIALLFLINWAILAEIMYRYSNKPVAVGELLTISLILCFVFSYVLNRRGRFQPALIISIIALTGATFAVVLIAHLHAQSNSSVLYYLIIVILMSELFFSIRGYVLCTSLILLGVLGIYLLDKNTASVFQFLLVFSALVGFAGYSRRLIETERITRASKSEQDQSLLRIERRRARQMELLNEITNTMLQMPDLRQALQTLADQLARLMEADGAFITLWDEAAQQVIPATAYGEYRDTYSSMKLDPGENTLTSSVLREGRTLAVEDLLHTPYMNPELASDVPSRSALALPLIANDRKLGAAIISFNQQHQFTSEEITLGEQAAGQIALAVFKAQLYDTEVRRAKQLSLLEEVGRQIADSLDENEILQRTVEIIVHHFRYAEVAISLLIEDSLLEVAAINGTRDFGYRPGYQQKMGQGIIGYVGEKGEPYVANDVSQDPYYLSTARRKGSALAVPMFNKEELLGIIYVETASRNDFKSDDVQTLQTLANQVATAIQKARLYARAQEHIQGMTILQSVSSTVTSSLELGEILHNIVEILKVSYGYSYLSIYLLDGDILRLGAELGYPNDRLLDEISINAGVIGRCVRNKQTQFVLNVNDDPDFLRAAYEVKSEICVPLLKYDRLLGVLNVESKEDRPLTEDDMNLLETLAGPLAVAIDNARLHAEVKAMALTDSMSGLSNRRAFDEMLHTELTRAQRYNHPVSLIIMDLDSFKQFNDLYGHPAGDIRLKEIAEMLKENVREPDIAARYGGEEFAVILPNTNKRGAVKLAERLRKSAEGKAPKTFLTGDAISGYTLSLGVAAFPDDAATEQDLLLAADNAELNAKRLGKNKVCAANL